MRVRGVMRVSAVRSPRRIRRSTRARSCGSSSSFDWRAGIATSCPCVEPVPRVSAARREADSAPPRCGRTSSRRSRNPSGKDAHRTMVSGCRRATWRGRSSPTSQTSSSAASTAAVTGGFSAPAGCVPSASTALAPIRRSVASRNERRIGASCAWRAVAFSASRALRRCAANGRSCARRACASARSVSDSAARAGSSRRKAKISGVMKDRNVPAEGTAADGSRKARAWHCNKKFLCVAA